MCRDNKNKEVVAEDGRKTERGEGKRGLTGLIDVGATGSAFIERRQLVTFSAGLASNPTTSPK